MKKYILISLIIHLSIFFIFKIDKNLGNEDFNRIVPITFVATKTSPNPGAAVAVPKEPEKKEVLASKPKNKEKPVEKKEIESKIANKKEKKEKEKPAKEIVKNDIKENQKDGQDNDLSKKKSERGDGEENNTVFQGSNFIADGDGGYIALSSAGINYTILNEVEPDYPSQAEMIGYSQKVIVTVKFLVGLKGEIAKIEIKKSHAKLGFDDEVKKAIKKWKFKPIYHHGKNIQVYFEKDFIFNPI